MEVLIGKIMETLILPPGLLIVLIGAGFILRTRFYRTGQSFVYTGFVLLLLLSLPLVSNSLFSTLHIYPALAPDKLKTLDARAIVILGGGRYSDATEYGKDTISAPTLERLRYGAYLQRITRLPILVTGGSVYENRVPEGELMKEVLESSFISVVNWVEGRSRTTYQNAVYTQEILGRENISDILLVTNSFHMPRSVEAFENAGVRVIPAPVTAGTTSERPFYFSLLPSMSSLKTSSIVMHEWIGRLWYNLRYY
jgi:uncharacterized SAM-binding protein YcdF (DUF218 family)